MSNRQVAVTGIGITASNGTGLDAFWKAVSSGQGGVWNIDYFDTSKHSSKFAAFVRDFKAEDHFDTKTVRRMDRFVQLSMVVSRMAMKDSGLDIASMDAQRAGVIIGTGIGGIDTFEKQMETLLSRGANRVSPFLIPKMIVNMAAGEVSIDLGCKGPNFSVTTACASSAHALGEAAYYIRSGRADVMVAGGTEAAVTPLGFAGFCSIKALSTRNDSPETASRPFDRERDGFIMGEGAATLILEELEHAKKRGAKIYGLLSGYGANGDAFHITQPMPEGQGAAACMRLALADAGINPSDVDYINAHGTSTPLNDKAETAAVKAVFGKDTAPWVSSSKSMTGHTLGAAGAIEAVVSLMAIQNSIVPPTINYQTPDPDCDLDYVPNQAREKEVNTVVSNSLGFGGHNASLVFTKV